MNEAMPTPDRPKTALNLTPEEIATFRERDLVVLKRQLFPGTRAGDKVALEVNWEDEGDVGTITRIARGKNRDGSRDIIVENL